MKQDVITSLKEVTDFKTSWDSRENIEISPACSVTSHTDIRLMSSYATFLERVKDDLFKDNRIARTMKRSDWAWELRCIIGLRAVEDLALTVMAQGTGTYEDLTQSYLYVKTVSSTYRNRSRISRKFTDQTDCERLYSS